MNRIMDDSTKTKEQLIEELNELRKQIVDLRMREKKGNEIEKRLNDTLADLSIHQEELHTQNEELRIAKHELEESHNKYVDLFDFAPVGYFTFDHNGIIKEMNLTGTEMLGLERQTVLGKPVRLFVSYKSREILASHFRGVFQGLDLSVEIEVIHKSGNVLSVELKSIPIKNREGQIEYCRTAMTDISDRKLAEELLHKLSSAIEQNPTGVIITDVNGDIDYVNTMFTQLTGYAFKEVVGKKPGFVQAGHMTTEEYKRILKAVTSGDKWRGEFFNRKKNMELYWESVNISPILNKNQIVTNFLITQEDITEQKQTEKFLEEERRIMEMVANGCTFQEALDAITSMIERLLPEIKCAIVILDKIGKHLFFKSSCSLPKEFLEVMNGVSINSDTCSCTKSVNRGKRIFIDNIEKESSCSDHRELLLAYGIKSCLSIPISCTRGDALGSIVLYAKEKHAPSIHIIKLVETAAHLTGITIEHDRAEQALKQSQAQLIQSEKMSSLGTMVAGVAHELLNPIMGAINFISFCLKKTQHDDERFEILKNAERAINRCIIVVENLLHFSHMDQQGNGGFVKDRCENIIEQVLHLLSYRIEKENVTIIKAYDKHLPVIRMQVNNIQQVFLNVIINALDALIDSKKKEIYIQIYKEFVYIKVIITDTGSGIDPELIQKIFDPFFTTKPPGKGTGLGLSISQSIVKTHEGMITCESKPNKGTKFTILLPINKKVMEKKNE